MWRSPQGSPYRWTTRRWTARVVIHRMARGPCSVLRHPTTVWRAIRPTSSGSTQGAGIRTTVTVCHHDHGLGRCHDGPHDPQQWVRAPGQPRHPALYELSHPGRRGNALRSHDPGRLCGVSPDRLPGRTQRLGLSRNVSDLSPGHHLDRGHRGSRCRVGWVRPTGGP